MGFEESAAGFNPTLGPRSKGGGGGNPGPTPPLGLHTTAYWKLDDPLPAVNGNGNLMVDATARGNNLLRQMIPRASTLDFSIGANTNSPNGQFTNGALAKWGKWNRVISATEIAAMAAGESWPFAVTASLQDARAFYLLNEASASTVYADATGRGNTLAAGGAATVQVVGPSGGADKATLFGGATFLSRPFTTDLQGGNAPHSVAGWIKLTAYGATQQMFWGQFNGGNRTGTVVYYHAGNQRFQMDLGDDIDLYRNAGLVSSVYGNPPLATWLFVVSIYDPTNNLTKQSINGGAFQILTTIQQPSQVAGKIGQGALGAHFRQNPDYRALTPNQSGWDLIGSAVNCNTPVTPDLAFGDRPRFAWGWFKFDDFTTTQSIIGTANLISPVIVDWLIQQSAGLMYFVLGDSAGHIDFVTVPVADNNWHMVVVWFDPLGDGKFHINLDNGAFVNSATPTHVPATGIAPFVMGAAGDSQQGSGFSQQALATLDGWGVGNGVPGPSDIAYLWNSGNGTDVFPP